MTTSTAQALLAKMSAQLPPTGKNKVAVIGAGIIGSTILFKLVNERVSNEFVLIDRNANRARDELLDIQNSTNFTDQLDLQYSSDFEKCKDANVVIVTAGHAMPPTRPFEIASVNNNVAIYREIIPAIMSYAPRCILVIVTKPVDIMTYVAWRLSGLRPTQVLGTGCSLLTKRFRDSVALKLGISPQAVQAFVVGENGANCIPIWRSITACGVCLRDINTRLGMENDPEDWKSIFQKMLESTSNISRTKTFNTYGLAGCVANIVSAIIKDSKECFTVSTHLKGCHHGSDKSKDVFISMPAILGSNGVQFIVRQSLTQNDKDKIQETANKYKFVQRAFQFE